MDETNIRPRAEEDFFDTARIAIEGMTCDRCVETIERAFRNKDGIREVRVDRANSTATVTFDRRKLDVPTLHDLLLEHGYHARRRANDEIPAVGPVS
jgi:copper chaperone CopZ